MIKVLGIGSPFGDDQLGWKVIDLLAKEALLTHQNICLERCDRPGIRLLELINDAHSIILIDAVKSGQPIGTIHRLENEQITEAHHLLSTHDIGIGKVLELGKALDVLPNKIIFYGIEIGEVQYHQMISFLIESRLKILVKKIVNEIILI